MHKYQAEYKGRVKIVNAKSMYGAQKAAEKFFDVKTVEDYVALKVYVLDGGEAVSLIG